MDPIITNKRSKAREDEHPLVTALREKLANGPIKRVNAKLPDDRLQKVQHQRIQNAKRRAGEANIRDTAKRQALQEAFLIEALKRNLSELNRRGVEMTLSQYRQSIGI